MKGNLQILRGTGLFVVCPIGTIGDDVCLSEMNW